MGEQVSFEGRIRTWFVDPPRGLAVIDIPGDVVHALGGGRRQYRVVGTIEGSPFQGSTMLVAGGGFAVGVGKAALKEAGVAVGDTVAVAVARSDGA